MRLIKLAVLSLIVFFAIITAMSLLIPAQVRISRAINLSNGDSVLALIGNEAQWPRWHPAFQNQQVQNLLQQHQITIIPVQKTDSLIIMQWKVAGKAPVINGWQLHHSTADSTTLQWYMDFHFRWYPWEKFSSLFYEKTYGSFMEQGLQNIKSIVQAPVP